MATVKPRRIFGIKTCDTMKKAFAWLNDHGVAYDFVDYCKEGVSADQLADWSRRAGWQALLNTRGTTWRKLDAADRDGVDEAKALRLMSAHPSLIKRPVLDCGERLLIGFVTQDYASAFLETA